MSAKSPLYASGGSLGEDYPRDATAMQAVSERHLIDVWRSGCTIEIPNALVVLSAYAWLADDTGAVKAAAPEVAERAKVSEGTVRRLTSALVDAGDLQVLEVGVGRAPSSYHLARTTGRSSITMRAQPDRTSPVVLSPRADKSGGSSRARAVLALELEEITTKPTRAKRVGRPSFDAEFAEWWQGYPRKVARAAALKAFTKRRQERVPLSVLTTARDAYAREVEGKDAQYIAHGSTFLGPTGRWSDPWDELAAAGVPDEWSTW